MHGACFAVNAVGRDVLYYTLYYWTTADYALRHALSRLPGPCLCAVCAGRLARRHHHHQQTVHPRRRCRISRWCSGCSHTTLTAADNDDWQPTHFAAHGHLEVLQWRSKAAAGAISCIWAKPSSLNLSATPLRTSLNGTKGMRRKTSLQLHGTGPVALIEAVRKFPNH